MITKLNEKGVSLIEVLIVMISIAILAVTIFVTLSHVMDDSGVIEPSRDKEIQTSLVPNSELTKTGAVEDTIKAKTVDEPNTNIADLYIPINGKKHKPAQMLELEMIIKTYKEAGEDASEYETMLENFKKVYGFEEEDSSEEGNQNEPENIFIAEDSEEDGEDRETDSAEEEESGDVRIERSEKVVELMEKVVESKTRARVTKEKIESKSIPSER